MNVQKEISWMLAFRFWFHFVWRYIAFGVPGAMLSGVVIGFLGAKAHLEIHIVTSLSIFFGIFFGVFIQLWVIRRILTKWNLIAGYRVLLAEDPSASKL